MGGRGSNSKIQFQAVPDTATPLQAPTVTAAQAANAVTFSDTDTSPFHDLFNGRQYFMSQTFGIDTYLAIQDYLHNQPTPGSLYSPSQQLNHALRTGAALTANQQYMVNGLMAGMHNLGYNVNLTRFTRVDFMADLGLPNFSSMSIGQIRKAIIGATFTDKGFVSTSYNHFAKAPAGNAFTDKAVKINYKAPAGTQALMPGNGPGGSLGEIVLAPGQNYTITGVRFTGQRGRSGSQYYNQIEIDITIG